MNGLVVRPPPSAGQCRLNTNSSKTLHIVNSIMIIALTRDMRLNDCQCGWKTSKSYQVADIERMKLRAIYISQHSPTNFYHIWASLIVCANDIRPKVTFTPLGRANAGCRNTMHRNQNICELLFQYQHKILVQYEVTGIPVGQWVGGVITSEQGVAFEWAWGRVTSVLHLFAVAVACIKLPIIWGFGLAVDGLAVGVERILQIRRHGISCPA